MNDTNQTSTFDGFDDWQDVANQFRDVSRRETQDMRDAALKAIPLPDEVLIASYQTESYEVTAWVVFRNGDKYYTVDGGHCSCCDLKGQWEPEEYLDAHTLLAALTKFNGDYGAKGKHIEMVKNILSQRVRP